MHSKSNPVIVKVFGFILIFILLVSVCFADDINKRKKILYINSFSTSFPTYPEHLNGLNSVFRKYNYKIDYEFMDGKKFLSEDIKASTHDFLLNKIAKLESYDLIMVSDDPAFDFILENKVSFSKTPIIFFSVNNRDEALELAKSPIITGVTERVSSFKTLSLIQKLRPQLKNIYIIIDEPDIKFVSNKRVSDELDKLDYNRVIIRTDKYTHKELGEQIGQINPNDAIVFVSAYQSKDHVIQDFKNSQDIVIKNAKAPIFHLWEHGIGNGFLGGYVLSHYDQAQKAANLAIRMLNNKEVNIPVIDTESSNYCLMDYQLLHKYKIDESKLPPNVRYVNMPETVWSQFGLEMVIIIVLVVVEFLILVLLWYLYHQRKKYLLKLKQNEEKLRITLQSICDGVIATDTSGNIIMINAAAEKLTGWSRKEAEGKNISEVAVTIDSETGKPLESPVFKVLSVKSVIGSSPNTKLISKTGEEFLITDKASPILNSSGETEGVVMVFQDSTIKRHQEKLLKESEEQLNMFFNQSLSAFFLLELKEPIEMGDKITMGKIDYIVENLTFSKVNAALMKMYGLESMEVLGKKFRDIRNYYVDRKDILIEIIRKGSLSRITIEHNKQGNTLWVHGYYSLIKDQHGRIAGLFGTQYDVTEKYIKEQKIKSLLELRNGILDNIMSSAVVKDVDNDFRILHWNKYIEDFTGISAEDAIGKTDFDVYSKEIARKSREMDIEVSKLANGQVSYETQLANIRGETKYFKIVKTIIPRQNSSRLLLSFAFDIDDLKRAQNELIVAKEKAETADKLKSAFLANMSHEIRTPLNSIVGFAYLLSVSENQTESEEFYDVISNSTELLLTLINDIVDYSKIESGDLALVQENCNIHEVLTHCLQTIRSGVNNDIDVLLDLESEEPVYITTDSQRLQQILLNLLTNSVKYTHKGYIKLGYKSDSDFISFYVEDTGCGIEQEHHEKIFERFFKIDEFKQGTGLGLSICKLLIDAFGGKIWLKSEIGKGSTFFFTIPNSTAEKPSETKMDFSTYIPIPIRSKDRKTLLIAEDTESNYQLLESALTKSYHLLHATNGKEAVNMFKEHNPDAVLMDLKMPVLDGFGATRQIREINRDVPIIAVTAYAYDTDKIKAFEAGCNDYIPKPIDVKMLRGVLGHHLF